MSCLYANTNKDIFKNSAYEPSLVSDNWAAVATGYTVVCKAQSDWTGDGFLVTSEKFVVLNDGCLSDELPARSLSHIRGT